MLKEMRRTTWQEQVAVFVAFGLAYGALRGMALEYWQPHVGLCLGAALLLPRRFWLALLAGNVAASAHVAYVCLGQYGWSGALLHLFPLSAFAMLLIWPLRMHLPGSASAKKLVESVKARHIATLLGCAITFALLSALDSTVQLILTAQPQDDVPFYIKLWAPRYLLGAYLGCLTVVPLWLAIHEAFRHADSWNGLVRQMGRSRLLLEGVVLGLGCVGLLTAMGAGAAGEMWRQVAQMVMFLPVAWMAVRYGWQGAAVGGSAASMGIMLTMPAQYDPGTIIAQTVIALFITVLLPLGAKINWLNEQERRLTMDHRQALHAARREIYQGELRLRRDAKLLNEAHEGVIEGYGRLLDRIQHVLTENEQQSFRIHLVLVKRLTQSVQDSIYPAQWQNRGLRAALWSGPITNALEECGVAFDGHISEKVALLSTDAQWTLYRMICEAVAYTLLESPTTSCIRLYVRVAMVGPQRSTPWAVLVVAGEPLPGGMESTLSPFGYHSHLSHILQSRLGALGLDLDTMSDRAGLYEGRLRANQQRQRITVSLLDVPESRRAA